MCQGLSDWPELCWSDAGLALALCGGEPTGVHLENYVLTTPLAWREVERRSTASEGKARTASVPRRSRTTAAVPQ
jgi:hypothetical protein